MRVLALTHVFPRAADDPCAPFLLDWARALRDAGCDVGVIAPHDLGLPLRHDVDGVRVRRVRYAPDRRERLAYRGEMHRLVRRAEGPALLGGLVAALASSLRAQAHLGAPDVLHVHWWLPGAVVARLARVDVPTIVTLHGTDVALLEGRPALARLARWALRAADRVEAVSTAVAEQVEALTGRAADAVNPMPVPVIAPVDPPAEPAPLHVLGIGRLVPEKGFATLLSAVALLDAPARVSILGEGPERARLRAQAAALDVELDLPGRVPPSGRREAYARAHVVVQASRREGFGLVAAEALVAGVPVVATDSGGVRDVLPAGELVPPDDVAALAARIAAVAGDLDGARVEAARLGEQLRERLSPAAAAGRTLEGYRRLVWV